MKQPKDIALFPSGEIAISWDDGSEAFLSAFALRAACPCAECVDENSGVRRLDPSTIDRDLRIGAWSAVGRYAISFEFSDGHRLGIYTFELLEQIAAGGSPDS